MTSYKARQDGLVGEILIRVCKMLKFIKGSSLDRLDLFVLGFNAVLTGDLVLFLLFYGFGRHLGDVVVACFVGLKGLDLQNLEVEVREDEDFLLVKVAQLFGDDQILMRHPSL